MPVKSSQHLVNSILHPWSSLSSEGTGEKIHLRPYSIPAAFHLPAGTAKSSPEHQVGLFVCFGSGWFVGVFCGVFVYLLFVLLLVLGFFFLLSSLLYLKAPNLPTEKTIIAMNQALKMVESYSVDSCKGNLIHPEELV